LPRAASLLQHHPAGADKLCPVSTVVEDCNFAELSMVRILVVEDFEAYRTFIISMLQAKPEFEVVCAVSDGINAVAKARELGPDLILMDIGLPELDGLEAARRIRELVPSSKIVFLTQETDVEVVKEALSVGAWGYISKKQTQSHLLAALGAILQGERFVSSGLGDTSFT